jgi:hypothetical protein
MNTSLDTLISNKVHDIAQEIIGEWAASSEPAAQEAREFESSNPFRL